MKELVSIVIPVFNCEDSLPRTLESIQAQSYSYLEVILVDDGSKDKTGIICDEICAVDLRFRVIHQENKGVGKARNAGLDIANGEFICFVDAGDYIHEKAIEQLYKSLKKFNADLSLADICFTDVLTENISRPLSDIQWDTVSQVTLIHNLISLSGRAMLPWVSVCNKMYRRNKMDGIYFMDCIVNEDQEFNLHFFLRTENAVYLHSPLYYYVFDPDSTIHNPETRPKRLYINTESKYRMLKSLRNNKKYEGWMLDYLYRDILSKRMELKGTSFQKDFAALSECIIKDSVLRYLFSIYIPAKKKIKFLVRWIWKK